MMRLSFSRCWEESGQDKIKGSVADASGGYARHEMAKMWCGVYDWPKHNAFYFSRYGEDNCVILAHEFVRRSNHFYNVWFHESTGDFTYTAAQRICPEDTVFEEWLVGLDASDPAKPRALRLENLAPGHA